MATETTLRIEFFGGLRISVKGVVDEELTPGVAPRLLAYLALNTEKEANRDALCDLLWEGVPEESARQSLRQALYELRGMIAIPPIEKGDLLIATRNSIRLNPSAISTDVAEFETLLAEASRASRLEDKAEHYASAMALYKGEFLPGFYDGWAVLEQERLASAYDFACLEYLRILEELGRMDEAVALGNQILASTSCQEEVHCALMRVYAAQGMSGMILQQQKALRRQLEENNLGSPRIATKEYVKNLLQLARQTAAATPVSPQSKETAAGVFAPSPASFPDVAPTTKKPEQRRKERALLLIPLAALLLWNRANAPAKHDSKSQTEESASKPQPVKNEKLPTPPPQTIRESLTLGANRTPAIRAITMYGHDSGGKAALPIQGGGIYVAGNGAVYPFGRDVVVVKLDSNLVQKGEGRTWDNPDYHNGNTCLGAAVDGNGNLALCGNSTHRLDYNTEPIVLHYDKNLSFQWDKRDKLYQEDYVHGTFEFMDTDSKGSIWAGGTHGKRDGSAHAIIAKFSLQGSVETKAVVAPDAADSSLRCIAVDKSDDSVYLSGKTERKGKNRLASGKEYWIRRYDATGNPKNEVLNAPHCGNIFLVKDGVVYYHEGALVIRAYDMKLGKEVKRITLPLNAGQNGDVIRLAMDAQGNLYALFTPTRGSKHPFAVACMAPDGRSKWVRQIDLGNRGFDTDNGFQEDLFMQVNKRGDVFVAGRSGVENKLRHFTIAWIDSAGKIRDVCVDEGVGKIECKILGFCLENELNPVAVGVTSEKQDEGRITTLMLKPY